MSKKKSIIYQTNETLHEKLHIGEKRHLAKQQDTASDVINGWGTFKTYLARSCAFAKWVKKYYGCGILADARIYVDAYLQYLINQGYSPSTQKTTACALAKLYGCSSKDFIPTQTRHRANITRSRQGKAIFAEERNKEFVDFCKATGLRRSEIRNLKPENLSFDEATGEYKLVNIKGKGGRIRECPILSDKVVERILNTPPGQKVWGKIPSRADIHSYRAEYCKAIYNLHVRPINEIPNIPKGDRYYCRKDMKGVVLDRRAMKIASQALGHNRVSVIAGHYLYDMPCYNAKDKGGGQP